MGGKANLNKSVGGELVQVVAAWGETSRRNKQLREGGREEAREGLKGKSQSGMVRNDNQAEPMKHSQTRRKCKLKGAR